MALISVMFLLFLLIGIPVTIFWIWALIDCLRRPDTSYATSFGNISPRLVWALIIFFVGFFGALIYVFVAGTRKDPKQGVGQVDPAATDEGKKILQMIAAGKITPEEGQRLLSALGKKDVEQASSQTTPAPHALKIGCGILVALLVLLILLALACYMPRRQAAREARDRALRQHVEQTLNAQFGPGQKHVVVSPDALPVEAPSK